jgi:CBS domain-containing protein
MTIKDVMTKQPTICRPETNLAAASAMMWENDCGALPVVTEKGKLVGILTDRDICIALGTINTLASDLTARDVVETGPLICDPSNDVYSALQMMRKAKVRFLPVVNEIGVLEGMVSIDDIVLGVKRDDGKSGAAVAYGDLKTARQDVPSHPVSA